MVLKSLLGALALLAACHAPRPSTVADLPPLVLHDTAGATTTLPADLTGARFTVVVFYAEHCPCFQVHEARLLDLARTYADRGVKVVLVDSEADATPERDAHEAAARGLPPIVLDPGARLADALGAEYATFAVVFDPMGQVRYRGGIDDDKNVLHAEARPWLRDALDDLLAGNAPRRAEGKALGCALQKQ